MKAPTIPLILLTGFLGAGKTTLLNRILNENHGHRVAVIVNEFGEVGIDGALISGAQGEVVELANGCLCCAAQNQLLLAIQNVLERAADIDTIVIETSGLADPFPVLSQLSHSSLCEQISVECVVTIVDCANFDRNLDNAEAAFQQIIAGDILLLNKVDLVPEAIPPLAEKGIRVINPDARIIRSVNADVPLEIMLSQGIRPRMQPRAYTPHDHRDFESIVLEAGSEIDPAHLANWIENLPSEIFRIKGFVTIAGRAGRFLLSAVGRRHSLAPTVAATDRQVLVVIGRALDKPALEAGLAACTAEKQPVKALP